MELRTVERGSEVEEGITRYLSVINITSACGLMAEIFETNSEQKLIFHTSSCEI